MRLILSVLIVAALISCEGPTGPQGERGSRGYSGPAPAFTLSKVVYSGVTLADGTARLRITPDAGTIAEPPTIYVLWNNGRDDLWFEMGSQMSPYYYIEAENSMGLIVHIVAHGVISWRVVVIY